MSTQVSVTLPDDTYQHIDDLAQLSNQSIAAVIASIVNGAFSGVNQNLKVPDIEVAVSNEQTKPKIVLTLPDATAHFLDDLYQPGSQTTTPELIMIAIPPDRDIPELFRRTIVGALFQFSSMLRAEIFVSKLSDAELLALVKGQSAVSDPTEKQQLDKPLGAHPFELAPLWTDYHDKVNRIHAARNEAYRRGLGIIF